MKSKDLFKHLGVLSISAAMVVSMVACSNSSDNATSTNEQNKGNNAEAAATADPLGAYKDGITVSMGRVTTSNPKLPEGDTYENNAYTRLVKDKLNVTIKDTFESKDEAYDRQVSLAIASGELPDMMRINSKSELQELVDNDLIEDLTDVYDQYATDNIKKIYDSFEGRALGNASVDGRLMALPATSVDSAPAMIWVRQDWLDTLGIKLDSDGSGGITLDELEATAKAFVDKDPGHTGKPVGIPFVNYLNSADYGSSSHTMSAIAGIYNAFPQYWLKGEDGNIVYGSTTEGTKEALGIMADWFKKGIIDPQFGTRTWDEITALLTNGQTGILFGPWHIPDWGLSAVKQMDSKAVFSAYALEDANGKVNVAHANPNGQFIVVRKGYEHPELAIKILNLFYDTLANDKNVETTMPEVAKYQKDAVDGSARPFNIEVLSATSLLDDYSDISRGAKDEISMDEVRTTESKNVIENVKNYMADPDKADVADWSKYHSRMKGVSLIDKLTKDNKFNWTTPAFSGSTESMKQSWANLAKLEQESFIKIITGAEPLSYFDTFVKNWKSQGGDQITKEIQAEQQ
ncbi:sugar ABC transporter substrate-binding protein [Paenibacillus sabinae]|uniref:Sugar ABC transporter periplasmic protein n=1 Tax=Paenibacillus sabinae T27 TaxID=1268072 RepID=X4ZP71_9BACL|nr:sugar ABC transporter substrate-binding protein [Paenibacillus sabinae]AHV98325.1 lipoprotein lplA Flags: Precursor [Paenibacillus sabinae T27]